MDYGVLAQHDARPLFVWLVTSSRQRSVSQHLKQIVEQNAYTGGFSGLSFLTEKGQEWGAFLDF